MKVIRVAVEIAVPDFEMTSLEDIDECVQHAIYDSEECCLMNIEVQPAEIVYDSDDYK